MMSRRAMDRLALRFADEDKGGEGGEDNGGEDKGEGGGGGGDEKPVPYARFQEVVTERNTARRDLEKAKTEVTKLTTRVKELEADDKAATVTALRGEIDQARKDAEAVDDYFSSLLEVDIEQLPEPSKKMVKDVPGGARAQYQFLAKHRTNLAGGGDKKKPDGPTNERKPDGGSREGARSPEKDVKTKVATGSYAGF